MTGPRILIVNTDYSQFLDWLYASNPALREASYDDQMRARVESLFGVADFYSRSFRQIGWDAVDVHANNQIMQRTWALEYGVTTTGGLPEPVVQTAQWFRQAAARSPLRHLKAIAKPALAVLDKSRNWLEDVLLAQIAEFRPDVILNTDVAAINGKCLQAARSAGCLIVGQIASLLPSDAILREHDLLVSSLPNLVDYFRSLGINAALNRLGFDPSVLPRLRSSERTIDVSFVGTVSHAHSRRSRFLENVLAHRDVRIWGLVSEELAGKRIQAHQQGVVWGAEMYQVLAESKITLNCHGEIADCYANNMRLFEATGVGTLLITDAKENLADMFEPNEEVVTYRTAEECVELIEYYLENEEERAAIAMRGQARTIREHTYYSRTRELADIILARC